MSITLNFEADNQLTREDIFFALKYIGLTDFEDEDYGFSGKFPSSNMHFAVFERSKPYWQERGLRSCVATEGVPRALDWDIGMRISFKYVLSQYESCSEQMHLFLEKISEISEAYFLLSFQLETLYAIRDEHGLTFLEDF